MMPFGGVKISFDVTDKEIKLSVVKKIMKDIRPLQKLTNVN